MCKEKTYDGTPYEVKVSRTVWGGGKGSDNIKTLPITIGILKRGYDLQNHN